MLNTAYEKLDGNFGRWAVVREIDEATIRRARDIFERYKQRGVIINDNFDDVAWKLSNQTQKVGLTLIPFEGHFHNNAMKWVGCGFDCYRDCIKTYIALNFGEIGLASLRDITRTFISLAGKTRDEALDSNEHINHIVSLLQLIPGGGEERDYVIEALEEKEERRLNHIKGKPRRLANFSAYLKFNDILVKFWQAADEKQKLFYFPIYFWWNLTSILPLRPTEFLLTPRDCLENIDGEDILTIRRTKLKGGFEKIAYRIADDYECKKYAITTSLANELRKYLNATDGMRQTGIGTLLLQQPHYDYMGCSRYSSSKYYSYSCLNTCLRYFYNEAIHGSLTEIARICLGDTRHLAMASLIVSGGSPVLCRELAGHSDIDVSSHYYTNISNLVECATIERYRKSKGGRLDIVGEAKYPLALPKIRNRVSDGWCSFPDVAVGDIGECLKATGKDGQIGDCSGCQHFWPDDPGVRFRLFDEAAGKRQVDNDGKHLMRMIECIRRGLGYEEDISSALLRLQHSSNHYGKCLFEKYSRKGGL